MFIKPNQQFGERLNRKYLIEHKSLKEVLFWKTGANRSSWSRDAVVKKTYLFCNNGDPNKWRSRLDISNTLRVSLRHNTPTWDRLFNEKQAQGSHYSQLHSSQWWVAFLVICLYLFLCRSVEILLNVKPLLNNCTAPEQLSNSTAATISLICVDEK